MSTQGSSKCNNNQQTLKVKRLQIQQAQIKLDSYKNDFRVVWGPTEMCKILKKCNIDP